MSVSVRFSPSWAQTVDRAVRMASTFQNFEVGTPLLLFALLEDDGLTSQILEKAGVQLDPAMCVLSRCGWRNGTYQAGNQRLSPVAESVIRSSLREAMIRRQTAGPEHIAHQLISCRQGLASLLLRRMNVDVGRLCESLDAFIASQASQAT